MSTKKKTKTKTTKKKPSGKFYVLSKGYNDWAVRQSNKYDQVDGPFITSQAALKHIEKDASDCGNFGGYLVVEKTGAVKVSVKLFAIDQKVKTETKNKKKESK